MNLADLINKKRGPSVQPNPNVSRISNISISKSKKDEIETASIPVDCEGALMADDLYLPWGAHVNAETLKHWQRELFEMVDQLAKLEGWPDDDYDLVVGAIDRQPVSTLKPDLNYFRDRLEKARGAAATGSQREPR